MTYTEKEVDNPVEIPTTAPLVRPEEAILLEEAIPLEEANKPIKQPVKTYRKFLIGGAVILFILIIIYLGMAKYFTNHFYFGTVINGISVSGKMLADANALTASELNGYTLNIKERGGEIEQIKAQDVALKYSSGDLQKALDSQNGFKWVIAWFTQENSNKTVLLEYDEEKLSQKINQLTCFQPDHIFEPSNPTFKYMDGNYVIVDGDIGNKVDKDFLYSQIEDSLQSLDPEIDLELMGCYMKPQYDSKSPKIQEVKNLLNKYIATKITYTLGDSQKILDGSQINQWLIIDKNFNITINEDKVKQFINELSEADKAINFVTSSGKTLKISEGDYVRSINKAEETQYLITAIHNGEIRTKEPIYNQTTNSNANNYIGNTYVEISLENQHIWFYKNNSLVVQGDVVTGNVSRRTETRKGIYSLKYKTRNVILRGPSYAVHVDFWMPFDGGIGIHDANWRSAFGNNLYKTNGSHGCVNSPYNVAKEIFNNIEPGTPVIVY